MGGNLRQSILDKTERHVDTEGNSVTLQSGISDSGNRFSVQQELICNVASNSHHVILFTMRIMIAVLILSSNLYFSIYCKRIMQSCLDAKVVGLPGVDALALAVGSLGNAEKVKVTGDQPLNQSSKS